MAHPSDLSHDTLLGGRIAYSQFRIGYRTGLEPVLMAAAVPARAPQRVAEIGCGAGAGLLCLSQRIAGLTGTGVEQNAETATLARQNLSANARDGLTILNARFPETLPNGPFDHCFANPPWHDPDGTASVIERRDLARRAQPDTLKLWIRGSARLLRHKGSLTLALPVSLMAAAITQLTESGFGGVTTYPFWPKAGREARILLLQARYGVRSPARLLPGMILHEEDGSFTAQARAVLEEGAALPGLQEARVPLEPRRGRSLT
ncbi:putative O-methyltransferase [Acetobacter malorum]|uniref:tRNA1(Val) (adenine(37)-N6)-methyltransferase n=1 Tax=Acetobacter malorum TaxID=178901 RepID=UPI00050093ED|nr:methyltransferase [Acetobacter malorum]KFL88556.1 putative O-methyltransferase [Acetobacter malorum]